MAAWSLAGWPNSDGSSKVVDLLFDPQSKVDDASKAALLKSMAQGAYSMDAVWTQFRKGAAQLPAREDLLNQFLVSPHRAELDHNWPTAAHSARSCALKRKPRDNSGAIRLWRESPPRSTISWCNGAISASPI